MQIFLRKLLLLAASSTGRAALSFTCTGDMNCSLNGRCQNGACACDPGWRGVDCGVLNLGPVPDRPKVGSGQIYPLPMANTSSWGGGVVFRDGKYHLYVSEMANHCGLKTWQTNSFIRHAAADAVDGPYVPQGTVVRAWSHNAMPWVTPDGYIAVWHIGNGVLPSGRNLTTGCVNGTTPVHPSNPRAISTTSLAPVHQIPYSSSPNGPWKMMNLTCAQDGGRTGPCTIDNPTPVSLANGTTLLAHRKRGPATGPQFGILVAPHWSGPYRNLSSIPPPGDEPGGCEDGFLLLGQRGKGGSDGDGDGGIHLLCHCNGMHGYPTNHG